MIVYVETNFLLELAYLQERCGSCDEILQMAEARTISLVLPAFCVAEARATLQRRANERREFQGVLQKQVREVSRSEPFRTLEEQSRNVIAAFVAHGEESWQRLEVAVLRVREHGAFIPLTTEDVVWAAVDGLLHLLSPQDAIVLKSVTSHAAVQTGLKCFVTQDAKGFSTPSVYNELSKRDCKVLINFTDAVAYIRNALRP